MFTIKNGVVRCVGYNTNEKFFHLGKCYEVKNNAIKSEIGHTYNKENTMEKSVIEWLSTWYEFEVVEDYDKKITNVEIKRVIFNEPATIILWNDGTKSVVKCQNYEPFDKEKGFALAYLKKLLGNGNKFNKEIHKWVE